MTKEELVQKIISEIRNEDKVDKSFTVEWLKEHYPSEEGLPDGFDKIGEMDMVYTLLETIERKSVDAGIVGAQTLDSVKDLVYAIALINADKEKIDIFKVKEDFGIEELLKKYEA